MAKVKKRQTFLGITQETKNEIFGTLYVLLGLFVFLSLVLAKGGRTLIGPVGARISSVVIFLMGNYVVYVVPLLVIAWGLRVFRGKRTQNVLVKVFGLGLFVLSMCTLLCLPFYQNEEMREKSFQFGGAIGNFLVSPHGIGIPRYLGLLGTSLIFASFLIISLLLTTNFLFYNFFNSVGTRFQERIGEWREKRRERKLSFRKPHPARVFQAEDARREHKGKAKIAVVPRHGPEIVDHTGTRSEGSGEKTRPEKSAAEQKKIVVQEELRLFPDYELPPLSLLDDPPKIDQTMSREELLEISATLEKTLSDHGIEAQVIQVTQGPVVTRFELQPAPGVKINRIVMLENDIAMMLRAQQVRILAPIPGKAAVGIEIPNRKVTNVYLKELLTHERLKNHPSPLAFVLGKTIAGEPYVVDLASMPHLLIAGATGSGKSVCLNSMIACILFREPPSRVKFIMIDPKRVELTVFNDIPHLLAPVVYNARKAAAALSWAVEQMENRYRRLVDAGVRNIEAYNELNTDRPAGQKEIETPLEYMPHIVIIIDELADLMVIARNEVEENVMRLAQMARAVGIHLVIATQRPSVNVITGIIKANFPTRIAFQVSSKVDSRTILDINGAEALLGRGDMLFSPGGAPKPVRIQGTLVSEEEVERLADYIREQATAQYLKQDFQPRKLVRSESSTEATTSGQIDDDSEDEPIDDELYTQAVKLILKARKASVSLIQRRLKVGYARAGRLMDMMEEAGIVGEFQGSKPREILIDPAEYLARLKEAEEHKKDQAI
jgi:S-DNA-T family DNA segregation ATPase FtsK/SpoIIIE